MHGPWPWQPYKIKKSTSERTSTWSRWLLFLGTQTSAPFKQCIYLFVLYQVRYSIHCAGRCTRRTFPLYILSIIGGPQHIRKKFQSTQVIYNKANHREKSTPCPILFIKCRKINCRSVSLVSWFIFLLLNGQAYYCSKVIVLLRTHQLFAPHESKNYRQDLGIEE